ncbi:MAG TPA: NUDIX domain-containing protein, partial [Chitinophagaceae bacterium]
MHSTIYFNDKPLFLCDSIDPVIEPFAHHDDAVLIDELNSHTVRTMIHEMENPAVHAGVFIHPDLSKLEKEIAKKFKVVEAAGGLVRKADNSILMIFRRGRWDLPKGKLDEGESIENCAVREVGEETGLTAIRLIAPLCVTMHTYHEGTT